MYAAKTAENSNESLCTIFLGATCLLTCRDGIASLTYHVTGPFATSEIMTWCSAQIVGNNMNNMGIPMKHIKCKTAIRNAPHSKKTSERKGRACDVLYVIWALGLNMGGNREGWVAPIALTSLCCRKEVASVHHSLNILFAAISVITQPV